MKRTRSVDIPDNELPAGIGEDPSITFQVSIDFDDELSLQRQITLSSSIKEWEIEYESITIAEKIYTGFSSVLYRANWYGEVALKLAYIDDITIEAQDRLQLFKLEVAMMKKIRHENLVLFCGACLNPPNIGIVTSWINGHSVYHKIHVQREPLSASLVTSIAYQTVLAMSYLHSRGCIHKDLRSKNVFIEDGSKAIITDYGVSTIPNKISIRNAIGIPKERLIYLSPEILVNLRHGMLLVNHTKQSDVFSFGIFFYEMLTSRLPFKCLDGHTIIWKVGNGYCAPCHPNKIRYEAKQILIECWHFSPSDRATFTDLHSELKKLKARYRKPTRSPSTPNRIDKTCSTFT
ncbi:hypothetical protein GJ496_008471 [Pomphorhynchus laevis]|nr:hypothetical protein GJ496_008471 [Pomphorhynchus laevis]